MQNNLVKYQKLLVACTKTSKEFYNVMKCNDNLEEENDVLNFSISDLKVCLSFKI